MDYQLITGGSGVAEPLVVATTFTHNNVFYKAALAETISWEGQSIGTYDVLLQSGRGTQRFTLVKQRGQWKAGDEIEQIGVVQQGVVDVLAELISQVRK